MADNGGIGNWGNIFNRLLFGEALEQANANGTNQSDPGARATSAILSGSNPLDAIFGQQPQPPQRVPPPPATAPQYGIAPQGAPPPGYDPQQQ
jgi:hypothetical protein